MKVKCPKCNNEFSTSGNDLKILELLSNKIYNISELSVAMNISRPSIYHHLNNLKKRGLIETYRLDKLKGNPLFIKLKKVMNK